MVVNITRNNNGCLEETVRAESPMYDSLFEIVDSWDKELISDNIIVDRDKRIQDSYQANKDFMQKWSPYIKELNGCRIDIFDMPSHWFPLIDEFLEEAITRNKLQKIGQLKMKFGHICFIPYKADIDSKTLRIFEEKLHDERLIY